jgi:hypothetical protein
MMRVMLYEAAQSMLHSKKWSWLKAWALQIAPRRGMKKAIVALARRLAVINRRPVLLLRAKNLFSSAIDAHLMHGATPGLSVLPVVRPRARLTSA